jgi:hypothetical protein
MSNSRNLSRTIRLDGTTTLYQGADAKLATTSTGVTITGDTSATNSTLTGYLRGPASFVIDPAAHGDDTGTVVIAGNLQVDGLTTTINSTTLTVDDLNIVLASGAPNAAAADGAGITIDGASATLLYASSGDKFVLNKPLDVTGTVSATGFTTGANTRVQASSGMLFLNGPSALTFEVGAGSEKMRLTSTGLGIGTQSPSSLLSVGEVPIHAPGAAFTSSPSSFFSTTTLGGTIGNSQKIAIFGGGDTSNVSGLALYRYRSATGTNWTTDGFSLRQEVDGTENIYNYINFSAGKVGIGTANPQKRLEVVGDLQLDADNASIWLKSGIAGTAGKINWTYNSEGTVYASAGIDYDTRATTGWHLDVGYPITLDTSSSTGIKFVVATNTVGTMNDAGLSLITSVDQAIPLYLKNSDADSSTYMRYQDNGGQYWDTGINYANNDFYLNYGGALKTRLKNAGGIDTYGSSEIGAGTNDANDQHLKIRAGTSGLSRVIMADTLDAGYIDYNHNGDYFSFKTSGVEALTVYTGGNVASVGDLTAGGNLTSSGGAEKVGGTSTVFTSSSFLLTTTAQTVVPRSAILSLPTGTYLMTIFLSGGDWYSSTVTGIVQHYGGTTNSNSSGGPNEIYLTSSGHAQNAGVLYARYQTTLGNTNSHGVQIWTSSQTTTPITIKWKRLA